MKYRNWILITIANLFIVALLGLLMRYKIVFSFPFLEQKHIQHAHSHFAFIAWISQAIYILLVHFLEQNISVNTKRYSRLLLINTILSVGMMISFMFKGYHISSNTFSFLLIVNSIFFTVFFVKDSKLFKAGENAKLWMYAALAFNILSTIGTFFLVYMMINKVYVQEMQLASVYFYLHFQYNGFFIFSCLGLVFSQISKSIQLKKEKLIFLLFFISTFPNYFLSILWLHIPQVLYSIVVLSALIQLVAWAYFMIQLYKHKFELTNSKDLFYKIIIYVLITAFTLKLCLQLFSTIPYISHLAYSLRPIVIAYLHLVLLVIISLFLLLSFTKFILKINTPKAILVFAICILLNELILGIQGVAGMVSLSIPNIHYYLFYASIAIVISVWYTFRSVRTL